MIYRLELHFMQGYQPILTNNYIPFLHKFLTIRK